MNQARLLIRLGAAMVAMCGWVITPLPADAFNSPPPSSSLQEPKTQISAIREGEELTLERVVEIALQRQPEIMAAQGTVDAGRGRVGQARAQFFPQIDGSVGVSRFSPSGSYANPNGNDASYSQYTAGVNVNQMLYDFGKTATRVAIQNTSVESSLADLASVEDQVVLNVKLAFFDLLTMLRKRDVAAQAVTQFEKHRNQAQGFFDAGVKPKYDVTKAEVDLSNAKLDLIRAENNVRLGKVSLNAAMGFSQTPKYEIKGSLDFEPFPVSLEQALEQAEAHSPDLKALLLRKKAAEKSVLLARKGNYPYLSGSTSATYGGEKFPLDEGWDVGLALSFPVFNGNKTAYEVNEAEANLAVISANEAGLRLKIYKQIQQGYLVLLEAEKRIQTTQLVIGQAEENYTIASGRYEAGVGNPVEVADADVSLSKARTSHVEALNDYKIAQAVIEQVVGRSALASRTQ